jgi:hypothetical protein
MVPITCQKTVIMGLPTMRNPHFTSVKRVYLVIADSGECVHAFFCKHWYEDSRRCYNSNMKAGMTSPVARTLYYRYNSKCKYSVHLLLAICYFRFYTKLQPLAYGEPGQLCYNVMDRRERGWDGMDWIDLAEDRDHGNVENTRMISKQWVINRQYVASSSLHTSSHPRWSVSHTETPAHYVFTSFVCLAGSWDCVARQEFGNRGVQCYFRYHLENGTIPWEERELHLSFMYVLYNFRPQNLAVLLRCNSTVVCTALARKGPTLEVIK